ncbi:hemolysin-III related-domain-containing protein [Collybia nuda]|uniref:Hemolysin-III related-domain-containing protein n=1 Tax=Collybia nuda TaxID=64659 RepID=A0A9P5YHT5_9AGAR|nr:hemolysin-III related-domain-containing protein [Collybia nuda]
MSHLIRKRNLLAISSISRKKTDKPPKKTLTWLEIPHWQRDNEFIVTGYRRVQNNWKGCIASMFTYLHNETINIHSHLWGAVLFMYILATYRESHVQTHPGTTWIDAAVIAVFLSSAVFCLSASAFYHTSTCHSEKVSSRCHALDYSGIVILTVGSFYPSLYYGFYCERGLQIFYTLLITIAGLGASYIVLNPEYSKPTHRGARTIVFIGLGMGAVVPVSHLLVTHGFTLLLSEMGFGWLLASGGLYIAGALLYSNRIPERLAPGRFDYFFASHQIFHFCVVLAAIAHYSGVLKALDYRLSQPQSCNL